MRRHLRSALFGLLLVAASAVAIACTPGGSGASAAPAGSVAPGASAAPPSAAPAPSSGGGYSY